MIVLRNFLHFTEILNLLLKLADPLYSRFITIPLSDSKIHMGADGICGEQGARV